MACLEVATGKQRWKARSADNGQLLRRDDLLLALSEADELAFIEATPERFHELGRIQAIEGKTWEQPDAGRTRILMRNHLEMASYDLPDKQ